VHFKTRYEGTGKNAGTNEQCKSRSVVCAFKDAAIDEIRARTPTVSRASTRLMSPVAASHSEKLQKLRVVDQGYTQSVVPLINTGLCGLL
jgi:hypothetical protein